MQFVEDISEFVFREEGLKEAFEVDIEKSFVEGGVLKHLEHAYSAAPCCFCANEILQLIWRIKNKMKLLKMVYPIILKVLYSHDFILNISLFSTLTEIFA